MLLFVFTLGGATWLEMAGVECPLPPGMLGFGITTAGEALLNSFP